jgi:putative ABC transport system permease protein
MERMIQNVKIALRRFRKAPGFSVVAVLTVALGIGANVAIFSVVDTVLLEPLPYENPDELVALWEWNMPRDNRTNVANPGNFAAWRDRSSSFAEMSAVSMMQPATLSGTDEPDEVMMQYASPDFFDVLGLEASLGRTFITDLQAVEATEVVLSESYWRSEFGGDPAVLGRSLQLNSAPVVVVGVLPAEYVVFSESTDLWASIQIDRGDQTTSGRWLMVLGRLAEGSGIEAARSELDAIATSLREEFPDFNAGWSVTLVPLKEQVVGDVQQALWILLGAVGLLLLIACANVANLFLVRATERQREMAVRTSLGASGRVLAGQLLTESILIAGTGAAIGIGLAHLGTTTLASRMPGAFAMPRIEAAGVDGPVLLFAVAITAATALLFGLLPALQAAGTSPAGTLNAESRGPSRRSGIVRNGLVVAEVAVSVVLLAGAALFGRSFVSLLGVDAGIETEHVLVGRVNLSGDTYPGPAPKVVFFEELVSRIAAEPGVEAAGGISFLPLDGLGAATSYWPDDRPAPAAEDRRAANIRNVTGDYFDAMSIQLLQGRTFDTRDIADAPQTIIVNRFMADLYWPEGNALGQRVVVNWVDDEPWEIVGIVEDVRMGGLDTDVREVIYMNYAKATFFPWMHMVVRATGDPALLTTPVREQLALMDAALPLGSVRLMDELVKSNTARPRMTTLLMVVFAGLATLLAAVGLYGVLSYIVSQRVKEIGVRVALGAQPGDVLGMVVRQGVSLALAGLVIGLIVAGAGGRVMSDVLFQIEPSDPLALTASAGLLLVVAMVACAVPAWRATRVAPAEALRGD